MSQLAAPASLRRISVHPIARDARLISEIPPPISIAPPQVAKRVEFASLSRVVQDRFLSAISGTFPPSPLVRSVSSAKANAPVVWVVLAVAASALGVVLFRRGFGTLGDAMSLHSTGMAFVFAALVATVVLATLRAIAMLAEARVLPYAAGVYLFPTTLIDARRATLEVLPLADLVAIEPRLGALNLVFAGGRQFTFELDRDASAEELLSAIEVARAKSRELASDADPSGYYALVDPLYEPPGEATAATSEPRLALRVPTWARYAFALALVVGALVGPILRWKRNEASDALMFDQVRAADSVQAYRAYLAHGSVGAVHRAEVETVLLPRAELRDARAAMLVELERATKLGTLAALRAFEQAHPDHGLKDEVARAKHGVYAAALERYRPLAPDADALSFVTRLLMFAEDHGSTVYVRFARLPSPSLLGADQVVASSPRFAGIASYPAQYFDDAHAAIGEAALVSSLRARFSAIFPDELVALQEAPPFTPGDDEEFAVLTIEHSVDWKGEPVTTTAPPGVFITPFFELTARFVVPDDGVPGARMTLTTTVPSVLPDLTGIDREAGSAPPEEAIYRALTTDAFQRFGGALLSQLIATGNT